MQTSLLALVLLAPAPLVQDIRLNGPLATGPTGSFGLTRASADGRYLVYVADRDGDQLHELYSSPVVGDPAPRRLAGPVELYVEFEIAPDGKSVLFLADLDADDEWYPDLGVVPIDGSAPPRALDGPPDTGGSVQYFQVAPDGVHAVFVADHDEHDRYELYSVRVDGSAPPVKLNGVLVAGGDVVGSVHTGPFALSVDGSLVLYAADQDVEERVELFVVPVDGSTPARKLPIPLVTGGDVTAFAFDPLAIRVVYTADQEADERFELFTLPTDASEPPRRLNGTLVPGGDLGWRVGPGLQHDLNGGGGFLVTSDGLRVVYAADQQQDDRVDLHAVPLDGSAAPVRLNLATEANVILSFVSRDSSRVVYTSGSSGWNASRTLSSAPIDGSTPSQTLSGPSVQGGSVAGALGTLDSSHVVYSADHDADEILELYGVPIDGSAPAVKLNAPLPAGGEVSGDLFFPGFLPVDGGVVYQAEQEVDGLHEIYFVPASGGVPPRKVVAGPAYIDYATASTPGLLVFRRLGTLWSVGLAPGSKEVEHGALGLRIVGDVEEFAMDDAGERVVYRAREESDGDGPQLDSVRTRERLERVEITVPGATALRMPHVVPDGSHVVFVAEFGAAGSASELYGARTDGGAPPARLDPPSGDAIQFWPTPDGGGVVFADGTLLFRAPVDGSAPAILLAALTAAFPRVQISADGGRVAFVDGARLFVVPSDGSAPAVLVSGTLTDIQDDFQLAGPDGGSVVFRTAVFRLGVARMQLFAAPADGGAPPRRLDTPGSSSHSVDAFALAPDGSRAVYLADPVNGILELFSVAVDAATPAVRLHPALTGQNDVLDFQIARDSRHAVYRADALTDDVLELFSVPLDASVPPVRLNRDLVAGGDVLQYAIAPDGGRVVFVADQEVNNQSALYSTPIHGLRGPRRLSEPLVPGGGVASFRISADSRTVAFTAQGNAGGTLSLLSVPTGGREAARVLAGPFQTSITPFYAIGADGSVAVYQADVDEPFVVELHAVRRASPTARVSERR